MELAFQVDIFQWLCVMVGQGIGGDTAFLESFRQMAVGVINCVDCLHFGCLCWHYSLWRWSDCLCLVHLCPLLLLLSLEAGFWNCATVIDRAVCSWAVARWHHTGRQVHFTVSPQGPGASTLRQEGHVWLNTRQQHWSRSWTGLRPSSD